MSVNSQHPEYANLIDKYQRCRDVAKGQDAVHAKGTKYLPSLTDQEIDDYNAYKLRASFFNATWRTISGLTGMLFRKPPQVEVPESVAPMLETVTDDGQTVELFVRKIVEECLITGRVGVFVDFPVANPVVTQADAALLNLRPTMEAYQAESIINWKESVINNRRVLTMVVLVEENEVGGDEFDCTTETQYRVLDLLNGVYRVRLFRVNKTTQQDEQIGTDIFPTMASKTMDFIPFYFLSSDDTEICPDDPPLIDLVDLNLAHYRVVADYEHGCHFTGLPTGYVTGHTLDAEDKIYIGSQSMLVFPNSETQVGFLEFSGAGLAALERNLDRKEQQMAVLGARMLEGQKKAVETAEVASIHRQGENSQLANMSKAISLGFRKALQTFSDWANGSGEVVFQLNQDFFPMPMDAPTLTALVSAWQMGAISKETLFEKLQKGQVISDSNTFEDEETKIANQLR